MLIALAGALGHGTAQAQQPPPAPAFRLTGELRERMEGFDNSGFVDSRDDLYWLSRLRLNAAVMPGRPLSFQLQTQDARVGRKTVGPTGTPFAAPLDLRQAFADVGRATSHLSARVGRQELAFGEQRLVGHLNWMNAARTFDAARVTYRAPQIQIDAFGASVVRILDGFDRSGAGNRFAGVYAVAPKLVPLASVEPYVFWRQDINQRAEVGAAGTLQETTVGARIAGRLPARFDYSIEMARQQGSLAADRIDAWAGHWQMRRSFPGAPAVRVFGEYNHASGDRSATDGVRATFDQLYPTGHDKLGLADQVGWRNIQHLRTGIDLLPFKGLPVSASYHSFWLAEANDGLYAANGSVIARVPAGADSTHVGQEVDVQVTRALTPRLQLAAGYARLVAGAFLRQATPGFSYSHPYVMATYTFTAQR